MSLSLSDLINDCIAVQEAAFGLELPLEPAERADEFHLNLTGLFTEVAEVGECIGWKPWADNRGEVLDIVQLRSEIADALRFLFNLAAHAGLDGESITRAFMLSGAETVRRQADGYVQRTP